MLIRNFKRHSAVLLYALFSSTLIVNASKGENYSKSESISNKENKEIIQNGLSKPLKYGLGIAALTAVVSPSFKIGCDYICYKNILKDVRKLAKEQKNSKILGDLNVLEGSSQSYHLKTILLRLMEHTECWKLANWLRAKTEKISWWDQQTKFKFLNTDEFIKCYKDSKTISSPFSLKICCKFIGGYLEYNKKSLFGNSIDSFDQIPNWHVIKQIIENDVIPLGKPEKIKDELHFKFQIKNNKQTIDTIDIKIKK